MNGKPRQVPVPPQLGQRLKRERKRRGWTLQDVAGKSGVTNTTILRTENGKDAAISTVAAVAAALGLSIDMLVAEAECATCDGMPPGRFICSECGLGGAG